MRGKIADACHPEAQRRRRNRMSSSIDGSFAVVAAQDDSVDNRVMTTTIPEQKPAAAPETPLQRQFVNFMFFRVDRAFRSQPDDVKAQAKRGVAGGVKGERGPLVALA